MRNLIIKGNLKMGKHVAIYNIPPKETCTPTKWCLQGRNGKPSCYALRRNFRLPSVIEALEWRFQQTLMDDFVPRMTGEVHAMNPSYFRIHSSGDFYSAEYVDKWKEITESCPDTVFRSTTRRRDLAEAICELDNLENVIIRESLDSERQTPVMGLKFAALSGLPITTQEETYPCLDDCPKCEYYCWEHDVNVKFEEF